VVERRNVDDRERERGSLEEKGERERSAYRSFRPPST
jgi:hypothetical protein